MFVQVMLANQASWRCASRASSTPLILYSLSVNFCWVIHKQSVSVDTESNLSLERRPDLNLIELAATGSSMGSSAPTHP